MINEDQRRYHVGYAQAYLEGLFDNLREAVAASWSPGASITRYGRRWHLTKIVHETEDFYFGRIGFVTDNEVSTLQFDKKRQDFVHGDAPSGYVVPFSFRKADGIIAYQLYPGVVRETTFSGALTDLLNSTSDQHEYIWNVESLSEESDFETWLGSTQAIINFDVTLDRPNPNYHGRPRVEELIEEVRVETLRLIGKAADGGGIDLSADYFRQALDHAIHRDYGKAKLRGVRQDGAESVWEKLRGQEGRVASRRVIQAAGPVEAPEEVLLMAMSEIHDGVERAETYEDGDEA